MMKKSVVCAGVFCAAYLASLPAPLWAEGIIETEAVHVTGTRLAKRLEEVSAPTYVVTREEIEASAAATVQDVLSRVPGVQGVSGSAGMSQTQAVSVRGLSTEVLLLVDGMPYNSASHGADSFAYDLRSIPLDSVERIEVVKGASSAVYGSHAAGGVINIITKKGADKSSLTLSAQAGSDGWLKGSVRGTAVSKDGLKATLKYSRTQEDERNIRLRTPEQAAALGGAFDRSLEFRGNDYGLRLEKGFWNFSAEGGDYTSDWDNTSTYYGSTSTGTDRQENKYRRFSVGYDDGVNTALLYLFKNQKDYYYRFDTASATVTNYDDVTWGGSFSRRSKIFGLSGVWGVELKNESSKVKGEYNYDKERTELAPFFEVSAPVGERGVLDLGLRYEYWDMGSGQDSRDELLPRLGFSWQLDSGSTIYASAGRWFAMPSLYEINLADAWGLTVPNPDLKPEYGWSYELGVKNPTARTPWSVGVFYMDMKDKIKYFSDPVTWVGGYQNIAEYRAKGVEAQIKLPLGDKFSWTQGVTYTYAEEKATEGADWVRSDMPRWDVVGVLAYANGPWSADFEMHYYADRQVKTSVYDWDDSFFLANLSLGWKNGDNRVSFAVRNLFDKEVILSSSGYIAPERRFVISYEHRF